MKVVVGLLHVHIFGGVKSDESFSKKDTDTRMQYISRMSNVRTTVLSVRHRESTVFRDTWNRRELPVNTLKV